MKKIAVFGSGNGSNFQAIIEYFQGKNIDFTCCSDKKDSYIHERAKNLSVKNFYVPFENTFEFIKKNPFELIVLAGYMRILPISIIKTANVINIHPSLLPAYKGINAIKKSYLDKSPKTGVTVHQVSEDVDSGNIIAQLPVSISDNMSLWEFETAIHKAEHFLYPRVIEHLLFKVPLIELLGENQRESVIIW